MSDGRLYPYSSPSPPVIPIVPEEVLSRFHVAGLSDSRFSRCARLLQSIWRERRGLEPGWHQPKRGRARKLGNLVPASIAPTGVNFLAPEIARLVYREVAYREYGALIEEQRLWQNLLSSQALTFNLLGRAKLDPDFGSRLFSQLLPNALSRVESLAFEHSPGRGDPAYLGDHTAFDAGVWGRGPDGNPVFVGIEVKYSEAGQRPERRRVQRLQALAQEAALYRQPVAAHLFVEPYAQFTAEHLLAGLIAERLGDGGQAAFMAIAPSDNREAWQTINRYQAALLSDRPTSPFVPVTLEAAIAAVRAAGDEDMASQLAERYTDFGPVHRLIDEWEPTGC